MTERFTKEWIAQRREAAKTAGMVLMSDYQRCIDHIEQQAKRIAELEAERRWIPVSERLPKYNERVLGFKNGEVTTGFFSGVTHWQPLPQPPESEEE